MISALLHKILRKSADLPEHFLALLITEKRVRAGLFFLNNEKVEIAIIGEGSFWDGKTEESLVKSADAAVSACGDLGMQAKKVIFGIPEEWVLAGKVIAEQLPLLKSICRELELTPLGFVNIPEAISHFLKQTEGVPLTGLLVQVREDQVNLALSRVGKLEESVKSQEKKEVSLQVAQLLKNYAHVEVLPSRMILYDGDSDLELIRQELMSYPWTQKHAFLHFPKVEIINEEMEVKAVAVAAGTEMGAKIEVGDWRLEIGEKKLEVGGEKLEVGDEKTTEDNLGFVEEDVAATAEKKTVKIILPTLPKISLPNINFGLSEKTGSLFNRIKGIFKLGFLAIPIILFVLAGLIFYMLYITPKAEVKIFVDSRAIDKEVTLTLSSKSWETEVSGSQKTVATGKKTIGEKARGELTIYNKTFNSKTFKKGDFVSLTGDAKVKFTLDEEVKVASASEKPDHSGTDYGKEKVKITAADIGTKYNLDSGNTFSVVDYSDTNFSGKNDAAFSGGSSRDVTTAVTADFDRVTASLSADLTRKAREQINNKIESGEDVLALPINITMNKKKFDKEVNSEAVELTLDGEATVKMYGYMKEDLLKEVEKNASQLVLSGYELRRENMKTEVKKADLKKDGSLDLTVDFSAKIVPLYKLEEIIKNITGKDYKAVEEYLKKLEGVVDANITVNPVIIRGLKRLPWQGKNITLTIVVK